MQRALGAGAREQALAAGVVDHQIPDLDDGRLPVDRPRRLPARHRIQQLARVGMGGPLQDGGRGALLQHAPVLHHHHAFGVARHHGQVVADHQHGRAMLAGQRHHQFQHIALHHRVQRRRRLIGDQQRGLQQHHRGQHHALAHTAGEFMRPGLDRRLGIAYAHARQHVQHPFAPLGAPRRSRCSFKPSSSWRPMDMDGLSEVIGSWNTMPMRARAARAVRRRWRAARPRPRTGSNRPPPSAARASAP